MSESDHSQSPSENTAPKTPENNERARCSTKSLNELTAVTFRELTERKTYEGHFVVCRAVTDAELAFTTTAWFEDVNENELEIELENVTPVFGHVFSPGTVMVIKEPTVVGGEILQGRRDGPAPSRLDAFLDRVEVLCTAFLAPFQPFLPAFVNRLLDEPTTVPKIVARKTLKVTSPSDVVLVDEADRRMLGKLGALKWYESEGLSAEQLRIKGVVCSQQWDFRGALKYYDRALRLKPRALSLELSRSAALMRLQRFEEAYRAAQRAFEGGIELETSLFMMGQAAYAMRDWQKAVDHFVKLRKEFPDCKEAADQLANALARLREAQTGKFDMNRIYTEAVKMGKRDIDAADYMGPIKIVDMPGKGKGIVVSRNIRKGTLLMASKALSTATPTEAAEFRGGDSRVPARFEDQRLHDIRVAQFLTRNPRRANEVYSLWAGDKYQRGEELPEGVIDMARIRRISRINSFGSTVRTHAGGDTPKNERQILLFGTASFFNHSCVANTHRTFYGDMMMVYAIEDLNKGDEITMNYFVPTKPLEEREDTCRNYGFRCECALCETDRSDPMHEERERIALKCADLAPLFEKDPGAYAKEVEGLVDEFRRTYSARKRYRLRLRAALQLLFIAYEALERLEDSVEIVKELLDSLEVADLHVGPEMCIPLARDLNILAGKAHLAGDKHLAHRYRTERVKYLKMAREMTRIRCGVDLDIVEYRARMGHYPVLP